MPEYQITVYLRDPGSFRPEDWRPGRGLVVKTECDGRVPKEFSIFTADISQAEKDALVTGLFFNPNVEDLNVVLKP